MWSPLYFHFLLRADASYSVSVEVRKLKDFLAGLKGLENTQDDSYGPAGGMPWLSMTLLATNPDGSWASNGTCPPLVNAITFVGTKKEPGSKRLYVDLLAEIGAFLQWEVVEEEDDDGNEDVILWAPSRSQVKHDNSK